MVQSAKSLVRKDATRSCGTNPAIWCSLPESKMRAVFVVIPDVFREHTLQMAFIHRNDVIQQVSTAALNPTLRNSILPGTFEGGPNSLETLLPLLAFGPGRSSANRNESLPDAIEPLSLA